MNDPTLTLWTIGHSNRAGDEFLTLLTAQNIEVLADIRRFPGSRKNPQFGESALSEALAKTGIAYIPFPELGGRRRPRPDSHNTIWRNKSFQGYADYMETEEFQAGLERLSKLAREKRTAIMCSEAVWWRCHRALIADLLKTKGATVWHIMGSNKLVEHPYTTAARVVEGRLLYSDEE